MKLDEIETVVTDVPVHPFKRGVNEDSYAPHIIGQGIRWHGYIAFATGPKDHSYPIDAKACYLLMFRLSRRPQTLMIIVSGR